MPDSREEMTQIEKEKRQKTHGTMSKEEFESSRFFDKDGKEILFTPGGVDKSIEGPPYKDDPLPTGAGQYDDEEDED